MEISIAAQTVVFLQAILLGAAIGVYYDFLRAVRREGRLGSILTALLDGAFWLAVIVAFALFVLLIADGSERSYVLVGCAGGLALYFLTLSPMVLNLLIWVLDAVLAVFGWMLRIILLPMRFLQRVAGSKAARKIVHKFHFENFKKTLPFFRD